MAAGHPELGCQEEEVMMQRGTSRRCLKPSWLGLDFGVEIVSRRIEVFGLADPILQTEPGSSFKRAIDGETVSGTVSRSPTRYYRAGALSYTVFQFLKSL